MYSAKDIEELNAKNIEYPDGSMHTLYEAEQQQRAYERKIRATKRTLAACDEALNNLSDEELLQKLEKKFSHYSVKLKRQESELNSFCNKTGLLKDNSRSQAYGFSRSTAQKVVWRKKKTVAKSAEKSIIKSIDIDDFEVVTYGKNFNAEVSKVIIDTMSKCESVGGFIISEIVAKSLPKNDKGTPVLQIEPLSNGLLQLSLNTDILPGKTLDKINQIFANSKLSIANTLEEAVWHESGHAKTIFGMRSEDVKKLYDELSKIHIEGISIIAYDDGTEALAELEVLRKRGVKVSKEWMQFYEKYIGRKY